MQARTFDPPVRASCLATTECLAHLLAMLDRYCIQNGVDNASHHDLHLIVEEACINIVRYAYPEGVPGPMSLEVGGRHGDGGALIEVRIEDRGVPFDPLALRLPDRPAAIEDISPGGLGVLLIRRLSDRQHYAHDRESGNVLTIGKFIAAAVGD